MKTLPPQRLRPDYWTSVQEQIEAFYWDNLFAPLVRILQAATTQADDFVNAAKDERAVSKALREGTVQYRDGVFTGDVDSKLGRALRAIGAEYNARSGVYEIAEALVPAWIRIESAIAIHHAKRVHYELESQLKLTQERLNLGQIELTIDPTQPVSAIEEGFKSTAEAIGVTPHLPPAARKRMEQRYKDDVRPYVVESTSQFIDELRKEINTNAEVGLRYEHLVDGIKDRYGIAQRRARFIARQETALFMAGYRRERFTAAGVTSYKWRTSQDERVRPTKGREKKYGDHRALDGQVFYYQTKAPAQFMSTKKPENPGEDFQCRCVDLAILE